MMDAGHALLGSAVLTWVMLVVAMFLRSRGWTPAGMHLTFGNRENLPPPTALAGRADRAARNMLESLAIATALFAASQFPLWVGRGGTDLATLDLGASVFFWARVAYWPIYLAGITYLRTAAWFVGVLGLVWMAAAAL